MFSPLFLGTIGVPLSLGVIAAGLTARMKGENLSQYDEDIPVTFETDPDSEALKKMNDYLFENFVKPAQGSSDGEPIAAKRKRFDDWSKGGSFPAKFTPLTIGDMSGEWACAKTADPDKRLLYIHGGAGTVGSALSHRAITSRLSELTGASVCAINYRLMPENPRLASIEDCRIAYEWILENGPKGAAPLKKLAVAGDSAGGNLTLSIINWVRDNNIRPADAIIAMSPATDSTFSGASIRGNLATDHMLRPLIGAAAKIPPLILLWGVRKQTGMSPSDPRISPIHGNLAGLPPILIQASSAEILYDDARRYTVKARRAGTDVTLQTWSHMPHVWQAFERMLPEATDALEKIAKFMKKNGF